MTVVTGPARTGSGERGPARILVVDDEVFLSDMVAMALRPAGYRVAQASSGRQALELAAGFAPDLARRHASRPRRARGVPPAAGHR